MSESTQQNAKRFIELSENVSVLSTTETNAVILAKAYLKLEIELQQLRLAAYGMAKHGAEFMRLHLLQGIAQAEYKEARFMNSADEHELAHRVSELSCLLSDAQSAFEKSAAAYRAAGEDRS